MTEGLTANNPTLDQLRSIYDCYSGHVYSICLRLLGSQEAAEVATADTFVRLGREMEPTWDEPHTLARLRKLTILSARERLREWRFW